MVPALPDAAVVALAVAPPSPSLPLSATSTAVRVVHLLAASVAVGGALVTWVALRVDAGDPLALATAYEWLFWGALGTLVMTGVGNLGAFAPTLPTGAWGRTFLLKLLVVTTLLVGSAVRACLLDRCRASPSTTAAVGRSRLGGAYAVTAGLLVVGLLLAGVLAHG